MSSSLRAGSLVALAAFFIACASEDAPSEEPDGAALIGEPDQSELRALINAANAPPQDAEKATQETGSDTQIKTENGVSQDCVYKRYTGTALYETLVSFDPNADSIWPGAITQTKTLPQGLAAPIALPRRPGVITVSDATISGGAEAKYSRTIKEPSLAAVREAVAGMFAQSSVSLAAKSNYLAETAYSMNEASVKLGVAASWMTGSVKANFQGNWLNKKTTMIVRFVQAYYTVSFGAPSSPEKVFGPLVTANDARPYMGPGNPPAFVSSVTYGRMLIMKVETDESERDLRAALDLAFSSVKVNLSAESKNVLQNSTFSVFVLGGSPDDAARIQASDSAGRAAALGAYIQNGANFDPKSPGVPISYTVRRLSDNETIKVSSTIDYQIPVCTPRALNITLEMQSFHIGNDGKVGGSTTGNYDIWMESSSSQGGALPPTQGDPPKRDTLVKGSVPINDDIDVPLGQKSYARVEAQQGATITIGSKFHSDAHGKECEMSRIHSYRFNPKTGVGEWTNSGANKLSCADKDTAFFGNNGLEVDLNYTFTP